MQRVARPHPETAQEELPVESAHPSHCITKNGSECRMIAFNQCSHDDASLKNDEHQEHATEPEKKPPKHRPDKQSRRMFYRFVAKQKLKFLEQPEEFDFANIQLPSKVRRACNPEQTIEKVRSILKAIGQGTPNQEANPLTNGTLEQSMISL